ncbi:hypothetical protein [Glutamicibacter ardleyensis]|uniref:XRE family transcriptional regulator n=1 Tax=Glutamicibacter ardleyensis TaxID=225894 RepID=A0ABQ2DHC1_9MICC|nr:hypothetical protein [Glutamicibacter ardleyensis]GGJ56238.1 hypothetical protein GCM10007173_13820 [Glutamicibacter ardleyensis]
MKHISFKDHLDTITGSKSLRSIAAEIDVNSATLTRQLQDGLKFDTVVAICRTYKSPIIQALGIAGLLTGDEVEAVANATDLSQVDDAALVAELTRRMSRPGTPAIYDEPLDNVVKLEKPQD